MAGHGRRWLAMAGLDTPWPALTGHGRPWHAMAGLGRPWPAMAGHSPPLHSIARYGQTNLARRGRAMAMAMPWPLPWPQHGHSHGHGDAGAKFLFAHGCSKCKSWLHKKKQEIRNALNKKITDGKTVKES